MVLQLLYVVYGDVEIVKLNGNGINQMIEKLKNYFKRLWKALWDSTDLDERAEAALKEAKSRIAEMKKELADVKKAAKNVVAQSIDVIDAAKGKKRKGKKPYYKNKNKNKTNNNSKTK